MRIAVLSDIHANASALAAVLRDAARCYVHQVVCLGDVVGYHAQVGATIRLLRRHGVPTVSGNHDLMAIGALSDRLCGPVARRALTWTRRRLTDDERGFLTRLPAALHERGGLLFVHSMLGDPVTRLIHDDDFRLAADDLHRRFPEVRVCFTGHTHRPGVVTVSHDDVTHHEGLDELRLPPGALSFVNPGSVGHPRDGDGRAAYSVFDSATHRVTYRRVAYERSTLWHDDVAAGLAPARRPSLAGQVWGSLRALAMGTS